MRAYLLFASACFSLGACTLGDTTEDDRLGEETIDEELIITPGGSDHPGALVVRLPDELISADPATLSPFFVSVSNQTLTFGVPLTVPIGTANLVGSWPGDNGIPQQYGAQVSIASDQTTTAQLAAFRYTAPAEAVVGINSFPQSNGGGIGVAERMASGSAALLRSDYLTKTAPRLSGVYRLSWGYFDGIEVAVGPNQVKQIDLSDLSTRRALRIVAPPTRELPNCNDNPYVMRVARGNGYDTRLATLAPGQSVVIGEAGWNQGPANYLLNTPGMTYLPYSSLSFDLLPPAQPGEIIEHRLGRLDVDDVAVDTPSGVRTVRGTYRVNRLRTSANGGDWEGEEITSCTTHTGLDVLAGRYRIRVGYQTAEAGWKTTIIDVTVPPGG